jgi:deazaflavin-dependent oxidoreductase (nitroreductase family)
MGFSRDMQIRISRTRPGSFFTRNVVFRLDRFIYKRSGGRFVSTGKPVFPIMLVTMTGRKSGQPRTLPLIYLRDGERLIACSGDARAHGGSQWPRNLLPNPRVSVQVGEQSGPYVARRATEAEYAGYWPRVCANYPPYATYAQRSGETMMFVLEPEAA